MSFINFLGLNDPGYGNFAKGILYVICEVLWKIVQAVGNLVDVITGLFYKLAGLDYLGSGAGIAEEQQDLLTQLFNQNIVSTISGFMILASVLLLAIFGGFAVLKQMYFTKGEAKSTAGVIKNMVLAGVFLIFLTPISLFAISTITTITSAIAGIFGNDMSTSLADVIFNASFSGDAIEAYNAIYGAGDSEWVNVTSWTEMTNSDFLFELSYGGVSTVNFYWYIFLLGGGVILFNLVVMVFHLIKRLFRVVILYILGPIYVARMVDDGGVKFKEWKNDALSELVSIIGTVVGFMVLLALVGMINDLELIKVSGETAGATPPGGEGGFGIVGVASATETETNVTVILINNLTKMLLLMAGTAVAKDSGELLGNIFKGANDENTALLEGIFDKIGSKENKTSTTPKTTTRVITKNTTTTRKIVDYSESVPVSNDANKPAVNVTNNQRNSFNTTVNNVDRKVNNLQSRTNVSIGGSTIRTDGVKTGQVKQVSTNSENANMSRAENVLNQKFNAFKQENDQLRSEWAFMKDANGASSKNVVKEFESASKDLDTSIALGEQAKIANSMNQYVNAYKKEEKVAKEGYNDFAAKSAKLTSDLTMKQQEELKKITESYKKAQVDYGKTARKLSEVSVGNMSASEALRVKEHADKQRAKLMEASSKANDFYNNQKKGV